MTMGQGLERRLGSEIGEKLLNFIVHRQYMQLEQLFFIQGNQDISKFQLFIQLPLHILIPIFTKINVG
jgi:hypothetical protein